MSFQVGSVQAPQRFCSSILVNSFLCPTLYYIMCDEGDLKIDCSLIRYHSPWLHSIRTHILFYIFRVCMYVCFLHVSYSYATKTKKKLVKTCTSKPGNGSADVNYKIIFVQSNIAIWRVLDRRSIQVNTVQLFFVSIYFNAIFQRIDSTLWRMKSFRLYS